MILDSVEKIKPALNKWSKAFLYNTVCPSCFDNTGHAGVFKKEPGVGYCVKCSNKFFIKNSSILPKEKKIDLFSKYKNLFTPKSLPFDLKIMDENISKIIDLIRLNIPYCKDITESYLEALGLNKQLWDKGYTYYTPISKSLTIQNSYDKIPFVEKINDSYKIHLFKKVDGLLIPSYHKEYKTGLIFRSDDENMTKSKYLNLGVNKKLTYYSQKKEMSYIPKHTFLQAENRDDNTVIYLCEGFKKAEAVKDKFKGDVIGAHGVNNFMCDEIRSLILHYRHRKFCVIPDRDYSSKRSVAYSTFKLIQFLSMIDADFTILEWDHNDLQLNSILYKIDDALFYNDTEFIHINKKQFIQKMDRRVRSDYFSGMLKSNSIVSKDDLEQLGDIVEIEESFNEHKPDLVYNKEDRMELWTDLVISKKLVVDISATGTGKSYDAGNLRVPMFKKSFLKYTNITDQEIIDDLAPEKLKLIIQSPVNINVETYNKFHLIQGRTDKGWIFDPTLNKYRSVNPGEKADIESNCKIANKVHELRNNNQLAGNNICSTCQYVNNCSYIDQINSVKRKIYTRMSIKNVNINHKDVFIIDEFGALPHFNIISFNSYDIQNLFKRISDNKEWSKHSIELIKVVSLVTELIKQNNSLSEIKQIMIDSKSYNEELINKWLTLSEPDKIANTSGLSIIPKKILFPILRLLKGEITGGIYYSIKNNSFEIKIVDEIFKKMVAESAGILILDATADKLMLKDIFGIDPYIISTKDDIFENVNVKTLEGIGNTYKSTLNKSEGLTKLKSNIIDKYMIDNPDKKVGVITFKEILEKEIINKDAVKGYFYYHDRSSNHFYDNKCDTIFTLGIPVPNLAAISSELGMSFKESFSYVARPFGLDKDGVQKYIIRKESDNLKLRRYINYKINSCYIQSIGRLRSLRRKDEKLNFIVLDTISLPFNIDSTIKINSEKYSINNSIKLNQKEKEDKINYLDYLLSTIKTLMHSGIDVLNDAAYIILEKYNISRKVILKYVSDISKISRLADVFEIINNKKKELINNINIVKG